jgi:hypothetical protein
VADPRSVPSDGCPLENLGVVERNRSGVEDGNNSPTWDYFRPKRMRVAAGTPILGKIGELTLPWLTFA